MYGNKKLVSEVVSCLGMVFVSEWWKTYIYIYIIKTENTLHPAVRSKICRNSSLQAVCDTRKYIEIPTIFGL